MDSRTVACGLGWFEIGLGPVEVLAPARAVGLETHASLLRIIGVREIASGGLIPAADDPEPWLWARVADDGLDGAVFAAGLARSTQGAFAR